MVAIAKAPPALNPVISTEDDPISRIVWSGSPSAISAVWVGGRKVVDKGWVTTMDLDELASEVTERGQRLAS